MLTLCIGDSHVQAGQNIDRFTALGHFIDEVRPDTIVIIGDFLDMESLSHWITNKRLTMEGLRYADEIEQANKALDKMFLPMTLTNERLRGNKKRTYRPELVYIEGNHEERCWRYIEQHPELEGHLDYRQDLKLVDRGFKYIPYKEYYHNLGVAYTHIPIAGNGMPRSGNVHTQLQNALRDHNTSIVYGHNHKLAMAGEHRFGGEHYNQAMSIGCFFEHIDAYAKGAKVDYWRGIVLLDQYSMGRFDIETIALSKLKRDYL